MAAPLREGKTASFDLRIRLNEDDMAIVERLAKAHGNASAAVRALIRAAGLTADVQKPVTQGRSSVRSMTAMSAAKYD